MRTNKRNNNNNNKKQATGTMSRADYMAANERAFQGLSNRVREAKYQAYLASKRVAVVKNNYPAPRRAPPPANPGKGFRTPMSNRNRVVKSQVSISDCTMLYAMASIDPFDSLPALPCIPDTICVPSLKYQAKVEGDMKIGTLGIGFVSFNPWTMAVNDNGVAVTAVDYPIVVTNDTYNIGNFSYDAGALIGGLVFGLNSNSPYTAAYATGPNNVLRLVAAGLEIEYTGQLLNQSGAITVFQNNGLQDIPNGTSVTEIRNNPRSQTCATSKDARCYISYVPTASKFFSYENLDTYRPSALGTIHNAPLIILVSGGTVNTTFRFKAIAYFEAQFTNTDATPSHADPIGFPAFMSARSGQLPSTSPKQDLKQTLVKTQDIVKKEVTGLGNLGGAVGAAVGTALGGNTLLGEVIGREGGNLVTQILGNW